MHVQQLPLQHSVVEVHLRKIQSDKLIKIPKILSSGVQE
jgi:hypothetical protein